jgi:hypothetical protein
LTVAVGELPADPAGPTKELVGVPVGEATTMASCVAALVGAASGVPVAVALGGLLTRGAVVGIAVFVGRGVWLAVGAAAVGDL